MLGLIVGETFHRLPAVVAYLANEPDGDRAVETLYELLATIERGRA